MGTKIQMACPSGHTSEEAFDLFLRRCKVNNLSEQTIQAYRQKLSHFFRYLGKELPIAEVTDDTVDGYILWLKDKHRANDITINSYLRHLRAFLYYSMDCGYMPHFKIKLPKAEKKLKETYSQEELERLLESDPELISEVSNFGGSTNKSNDGGYEKTTRD